MKSRNSTTLRLAVTLLSLLLLASCAHDLPTPVSNQLNCPKLEPVDPLLMAPVTPHFQKDWQNWLNSTPTSSNSLMMTL